MTDESGPLQSSPDFLEALQEVSPGELLTQPGPTGARQISGKLESQDFRVGQERVHF
jgi:lipopolysaccharide/colanic/teichoic acid biosynthesis glycosyltransferase